MNPVGKEYTLSELARLFGVKLQGDGSIVIRGVAPIERADRYHITFIESRKFLPPKPSMITAGAIVTHPSLAEKLSEFPLILSPTPKATFARIAQIFYKGPALPTGVHPMAWINPKARVEANVRVGPFVCIGDGSTVGKETVIMAHCYVGSNVVIGSGCLIYPGVIILDGCTIGDRVIIHSGTVIGSDGFGYALDEQGEPVKIPQLGTVVIEDDVEIGANCTIDRATFGETRIKRGSKIDNLVTVAHNVTLGQRCIIAGQSGIAGSSILGDGVIVGGQVGITDHIVIGNGVRIGAKSGVFYDVKDKMDIFGIPALPKEEYLRIQGGIRRIERLRKKVKDLEEIVQKSLTGTKR
ncbi:MAG: UDP-3-O-(3-hydroxymyristoyl)glucosamine N-acyltransferase [Syntrophobacterales bacterium]|nr:UDP-3-O-(3-hydroxymyristoyl)glucosamine N-acyltransferase [Syntrophobacterales bacterium]